LELFVGWLALIVFIHDGNVMVVMMVMLVNSEIMVLTRILLLRIRVDMCLMLNSFVRWNSACVLVSRLGCKVPAIYERQNDLHMVVLPP
jgi:hypothetical protein